MKTDEQLMREYQSGSEEAFGILYDKYSSMVYAFIRKRMRLSEQEDLFQKVWRQLHEKRHLYKDQPFAPWFFVMIRHLLIDEYRSLGRKGRELKDELLDQAFNTQTQDSDIEEILSRLPDDSRDLVIKYYLEEISYVELENSTGLSQANLRQRLSRALKGLRRSYEK
jgi:RNA polymerase sigma-70 factor (ECF subfamily)